MRLNETDIKRLLEASTLRRAISSLWKERYDTLTASERQGVRSAIASSPAIADPLSVLRTLRRAHEHMGDVSTAVGMAGQFAAMEGFDLGNLDDVAEEYEELCLKCGDEEERKMSDVAERVGKCALVASDETRSAEERWGAELEGYELATHGTVMEPLIACLRQVQLFNVEKRFGCVEESYQALGFDERKPMPLSYRQKWNDPFRPAITLMSKPRTEKQKAKKKMRALKALTAMQSNCEFAVKELQEINATLSNLEEPIAIPTPPPDFTYADVPVPHDIPDDIRQRFFDAEFAYEEIVALQEEASEQLLNVRSAFVAWYTASQEVWYVHLEALHSSLLTLSFDVHERFWLKMLVLLSDIMSSLFSGHEGLSLNPMVFLGRQA